MPEKLQTPKVRIAFAAADQADAARQGQADFDLISQLLDRGLGVTRTAGQIEMRSDEKLVVLRDGDPSEAPADSNISVLPRDGKTLSRIDALLQEEGLEPNRPGDKQWKPWFPVIDYNRCTNCMQCLSFCLFDVYGVDSDNQIQVQNNDNCKTDCPACSRVCPEVAIMFPKYKAGPINGDEVSEEDVNREAMKMDISDLLGGDIYSRLRQRHETARQRFAKERDDKRALNERMRCLSKLQGEMDIPMSAIKDLPDQQEIERRAETARRRAEEAQAAAPSSPPGKGG